MFRPHFRHQAVEARVDQLVFPLDLREIVVGLIVARFGTTHKLLRAEAVLRFVRVVPRLFKEVCR